MTTPLRLAVAAKQPNDVETAGALADKLSLTLMASPWCGKPEIPKGESACDAVLLVNGSQLLLQQLGAFPATAAKKPRPGRRAASEPGPVIVDFGSPAMRHRRRGGANELLGRAVGVGKKRPMRVLDATAGLGRDAFVLADLGCELLMCERHPIVFELLSAGLHTAQSSDDEWQQSVAARMSLVFGDVIGLEEGVCRFQPDVIYLDPMFAPREKSAAVKKDLALLQHLLGPAEDQEDPERLLKWAMAQRVARVVVKRALKAPDLGISPAYCIRGKAVRYDVYVLRDFESL